MSTAIASIQTSSPTPNNVLHVESQRLAINGTRMNETLQSSCQWGATDDGGMNRLALNDDDASVRRWFIQQVLALDCKVTVDAMGNIFAVRPGLKDGPPIAMGSHLDTQPTGGRYDGILGVLAGLEVLRTLHENTAVTENPLAVVVWTNEEGARFIPSMLGSAVWSGDSTLEFGHTRKDEAGVSVKDELTRHGFLGKSAASHFEIPLKAHFELHIEQGPILDQHKQPVAVVSGVQAFRWFDIRLSGRGSHAGTTPMAFRHDPLEPVARMILAAKEVALKHGGLATIGRIGSESPQSTNCIMNDVSFHLDLRHHQDAVIDQMEKASKERFHSIANESLGVRFDRFIEIADSKAVTFDPLAVSCVKAACAIYDYQEIVSGAGHDSVHTSKRCPTAMIFIRCKDGVSHHPSEYSTPEDITVGAQILLDSVLRYDAAVGRA